MENLKTMKVQESAIPRATIRVPLPTNVRPPAPEKTKAK